MPERSLQDERHAERWRCVGTSSLIVAAIEESNGEIANSLEPPVPDQFEEEWVSRGDLYKKVFKLFSYGHSSYSLTVKYYLISMRVLVEFLGTI